MKTLMEIPRVSGLERLVEWLEFFDDIGGAYRAMTGGAWPLAIVIGTAAVDLRWQLEREARNGKAET